VTKAPGGGLHLVINSGILIFGLISRSEALFLFSPLSTCLSEPHGIPCALRFVILVSEQHAMNYCNRRLLIESASAHDTVGMNCSMQ
jgi:hypothetical protein